MTTPKTIAASPKNWRPFKTWISITPQTNLVDVNPPRFTSYREIGRIASDAYNRLRNNAFIKLPEPQASAITSGGTLISGIAGSFGYTPQIGNNEPYIYIMGHYYSELDIENTFSKKPVFSGGVLYNIPVGYPSLGVPNVNVLQDVKDLKVIIDSEMTTALPVDVNYNIDKIDYLGVIFGVGGYHFPR